MPHGKGAPASIRLNMNSRMLGSAYMRPSTHRMYEENVQYMLENEGRGGGLTKPQSQEPSTKYTQFFSRCCWQVRGELWAYTPERFDAASKNSSGAIQALETKNAQSAIGALGKAVGTQEYSVDTQPRAVAPRVYSRRHAVHRAAAEHPTSFVSCLSCLCCRTTGFQY